MAPLTDTQRRSIEQSLRNDAPGRVCGRCLRPRHLMRECRAALHDCWTDMGNAEEAEAIYQGFLQTHAPIVDRTLRAHAPTFVPSSTRAPTVHQTPRGNAPTFVPSPAHAPTVHQAPRGHASTFVPSRNRASTAHQTPRAHASTFARSSTDSWRNPMAETNASFRNTSVGASLNAHTPAGNRTTNQQAYPTQLRDGQQQAVQSRYHGQKERDPKAPPPDTTTNQQAHPTELRNGQQQAVQYKYHGQKESDPKAPPSGTKDLIYTHTTTPLPQKRNAKNAVMTNFVQVKSIPDKLFEYSISNSYSQSQENGAHQVRSLNRGADLRHIFEEVQQPYLNGLLGNRAWATDFAKLWTDSELANHSAIPSHQFTFITSSGESVDLTIQVSFTKSLDNIRQTLQTQQIQDASEAITALNAIVTRPLLSPRTGFSLTQTGANRLYINEGHEALHPLRAHRGYYSSIRPGKGGIFLNVNTITSAFFRPCRVSDLILEIRGHSKLRGEVSLNELEKWLRGITLRVVHERSQPSTPSKRSGDINAEKRRLKTFKNFGKVVSQQRFWTREESATDAGITVYDYFTNTLNIQGLDKKLECVNVGKPLNLSLTEYEKSKKGAIWIPAELLEIKPYQRMKAQLCPAHTTAMIKLALREPAAHAQLIIEEGLDVLGIRNASGQPAPTPAVQGSASNVVQNMSDFDLDDRLVDVPANFLMAPRLRCRRPQRGQYSDNWTTPQTASWNLVNTAFRQAGNIDFLNLYILETDIEPDKQGYLIRDMTNRLVHHGLNTQQGYEGSGQTFQLDGFWTNALQAKGSKTTLVVFHKEDLFNNVKWKADLVYGVHNVCALINKIKWQGEPTRFQQPGYQTQHLDNLALKFNMKTGGYNFLFDDVALKKKLDAHRETTIIFGADVNHPPLMSYHGIPSVAAVVASLDRSFQNYPGSMRLQAGNQEMIDDMEGMVYERLEAWCTHTENQIPDPDNPDSTKPRVPTLLLFYRDGLSESQFAECREKEIKAVRTAFTRIASEYSPDTTPTLELTFIVAGKRHNTRFYPKQRGDSCFNPTKPSNTNGQGNVRPGLLVSEVITTPGTLNFYLQSHAAIKGTARSAHYHVLHDDHAWNVLDLADLTHMLCYCFPRATKGVSYAAPAYIADRLCDRGRVWLKHWTPPKEQFLLPPKDDGKSRTKEEVIEWKKGKAREVARRRDAWGPNFNYDSAMGKVRFNPWHPNLDESMFWM